MADAVMTPKMEKWERDFNSIGRVEIGFNSKAMLPRVAVAAALLAALIWGMYNDDLFGTTGLVVAILAAAIFLLGTVSYVQGKWGGTSIIIERDSIVTMDGIRVPWIDIDHATVFYVPRSGPAVQLVLTEQAWNAFISSQSRGGKILHNSNKLISANRGLVMPQYLDAKPKELAGWLNYRRSQHPER